MKLLKAVGFLAASILSGTAQAYTVSLQANNNTDINVKTSGTYSYEEYNVFHRQSPLPVINRVIAPHGRNIPLDNLRRNLTNYDIEYFDFTDTNNRVLARCLSTYFPIREDAVLRFTLHQLQGQQHQYKCTREVVR